MTKHRKKSMKKNIRTSKKPQLRLLTAILGIVLVLVVISGFVAYQSSSFLVKKLVPTPSPSQTAMVTAKPELVDIANRIARGLNEERDIDALSYQTVKYGGISIDVPVEWDQRDTEKGPIFTNADQSMLVAINIASTSCFPSLASYTSQIESMGVNVQSMKEYVSDGHTVYRVDAILPNPEKNDPLLQNFVYKGTYNNYDFTVGLFGFSKTNTPLADRITNSVKLQEDKEIPVGPNCN